MMSRTNSKLAIIGLGYVGLPLAHAFSEKYDVIGSDITERRIDKPVLIDIKGIVEDPTWRL